MMMVTENTHYGQLRSKSVAIRVVDLGFVDPAHPYSGHLHGSVIGRAQVWYRVHCYDHNVRPELPPAQILVVLPYGFEGPLVGDEMGQRIADDVGIGFQEAGAWVTVADWTASCVPVPIPDGGPAFAAIFRMNDPID